jgi:hypothetical protein
MRLSTNFHFSTSRDTKPYKAFCNANHDHSVVKAHSSCPLPDKFLEREIISVGQHQHFFPCSHDIVGYFFFCTVHTYIYSKLKRRKRLMIKANDSRRVRHAIKPLFGAHTQAYTTPHQSIFQPTQPKLIILLL